MLRKTLSTIFSICGWICVAIGLFIITSSFAKVSADQTGNMSGAITLAFLQSILGLIWAGSGMVLVGISRIAAGVSEGRLRFFGKNTQNFFATLFGLVGFTFLSMGIYGAILEYSKPEGSYDIAMTYVWSAIFAGGFLTAISLVLFFISHKIGKITS